MVKTSMSHEDYLEAIVMLGGTTDAPVRSVDVANKLGVSKASVNKAISALKEQELVCHLEGGCKGDLLWMVEAVGNVLKNCMEHTPVGGRIVVEGSENMIYSQLLIRDTGPGIQQKDLPHLFERFYKGESSSAQSVGIGLALSQSIIHNQNGYIRAGNAPEGGAEFVIRFYKAVV